MLGSPDFAWKQIKIVPTDDDEDEDDDSDNYDDDNDYGDND